MSHPAAVARLALAFTLLGGGIAFADDYPTALIGRPLTLEPSTFQATVAGELIHDSAVVAPAPSNLESLVFAADYAVAHHLQVGAVVVETVSPDSSFALGLANAQYQLLAFAAARLDVGVARVDNGDHDASFGVGLPIRLRLTDRVALISGRPYAFGAEDDLVTLRLSSFSDGVAEYRLPLGILYQANDNFSFAVRSGFRREGSADFVPLGLDLTYAVSRIDLGVTADVAGQVSPSNGLGYFDVTTFRLWAQLRL